MTSPVREKPVARGRRTPGVRGGRPRNRWAWTSSRTGAWTIRLITLVTILISWELYAARVSRALLAGPIDISESAYRLTIEQRVILDATLITFGALTLGLALSVVLGIVIGLVMGRIRSVERVLDPYVTFFNALPSIVLIPLLLVLLGFSLELRITLVLLASVFPVIINTMTGVKAVPTNLLEVGRMQCASERQLVRTIVLPSATPYIFIGIRQALSQALVMTVVAEILVAVTGLGGLMVEYANYFRTADLFVPLFVIMGLSLFLTALIKRIERWVAPWNVK